MSPMLSIIAPCYNEADCIMQFYMALKTVLAAFPELGHEIIFIDDGSTDDTLRLLKELAQSDPSLRVVVLSRNFGHQIALTAGIDFAEGDALIMMDSDLQHPVELIPQLIEGWKQGYDIVTAIRQETMGVSFFKSFTSKAFYLLFNKLSSTRVPVGAADYCLLSKTVYLQLREMKERHRFLRGLVCWMGFSRMLIPYTAPARIAGTSKYSLPKMVKLALEAIFSFSSKPLTAAIRAGMLLTLAGSFYLLYILYGYFIRHNLIPGWASLICSLLILNGFQLIFIGLIGEYIARIFEETKNRPLYLIKEIIGHHSR